jgi:diaminopimelate epimerase
MYGSGNDFIFFDARSEAAGELASPGRIAQLCARGTGIGADGVVFVEPSPRADFAIRYFNADGSLASLCGHASLCSTRLAVRLGAAEGGGMRFETGAGVLRGRIKDDLPEIDLAPVETVFADAAALEPGPGEHRIGFAIAGVPHVVLACDDVAAVDVQGRGPALRWHPSLPEGANVNWVSRQAGGWAIRTFERGVEGETLACGTGAVAAAVLLAEWGLAPRSGVALETASGRQLEVSITEEAGLRRPSLRGEGRIVFEGRLAEV